MPQPTIAEMRLVCQPDIVLSRRSDEHWAGRLYMRGVSIHVTRFAVGRGVGADAVTVTMALIGVLGAGLVAIGGWWPALAGVVAVQLYLLLDCADGEVARWNHTESARGIYLDRVSHYLVEAALMAALGWRAGGGEHSVWFSWGLAAGLFVVLARIETDLVDAARAKMGRPAIGDGGASLRSRPLRGLRRLADWVPVHRITGAVEASLLILAAAVCDRTRDDLAASRILVATMAVVAGVVALAHLVSILASDRLR